MPTKPRSFHHLSQRQDGVSLVVVLLLLIIVSMLGVASMQIATMGERGARNDRDMQLAWQSAEAALVDAEIDLAGPNIATVSRTSKIAANPALPDFGCQTSTEWRGLCSPVTSGTDKPTWLTIDFTNTANTAPSVALGTFTARSFASAGEAMGTGIQTSLRPRYTAEDVTVSAGGGRMVGSTYQSAGGAGTNAAKDRLYRVTAMGFGPRSDIQAVLQTIYRN